MRTIGALFPAHHRADGAVVERMFRAIGFDGVRHGGAVAQRAIGIGHTFIHSGISTEIALSLSSVKSAQKPRRKGRKAGIAGRRWKVLGAV